MLKKLSHHWHLDNQVIGNQKFFVLNIFLNNKSNHNVNTKLNIYTNKLISCNFYNIDLTYQYAKNHPEYEKYTTNKKTPVVELKQEIYFPKNNFFAKYKYMADINVYEENTLMIIGNNEYETMIFELCDKKNIYNFTISKSNNLLE